MRRETLTTTIYVVLFLALLLSGTVAVLLSCVIWQALVSSLTLFGIVGNIRF